MRLLFLVSAALCWCGVVWAGEQQPLHPLNEQLSHSNSLSSLSFHQLSSSSSSLSSSVTTKEDAQMKLKDLLEARDEYLKAKKTATDNEEHTTRMTVQLHNQKGKLAAAQKKWLSDDSSLHMMEMQQGYAVVSKSLTEAQGFTAQIEAKSPIVKSDADSVKELQVSVHSLSAQIGVNEKQQKHLDEEAAKLKQRAANINQSYCNMVCDGNKHKDCVEQIGACDSIRPEFDFLKWLTS